MTTEAIEVRSLPSLTVREAPAAFLIYIPDDVEDAHAEAMSRMARLPASKRKSHYLYIIEETDNGPSSRSYWVDYREQFFHSFPNFIKKGVARLTFYAVPRRLHQLATVHIQFQAA